jgi:hypothetical protein
MSRRRTRRELEQLNAGQVGVPVRLVVGAIAPGFVQIFAGWNVWEVWQSQEPILGVADSVLNLGVPLERQLRIWVEDKIKDGAPAAAVADPLNPLALKGAQVEIISNPAGLELLQTRGDIPELAGALQLGKEGSQALKRTVRFFNRGSDTGMSWPHDQNYLLDAVYQPSRTNPITNGAAPGSLGGAADKLEKQVGAVVTTIAVVGGVALGAYLLISILNAQKAVSA